MNESILDLLDREIYFFKTVVSEIIFILMVIAGQYFIVGYIILSDVKGLSQVVRVINNKSFSISLMLRARSIFIRFVDGGGRSELLKIF
jgi:hypothetical protein